MMALKIPAYAAALALFIGAIFAWFHRSDDPVVVVAILVVTNSAAQMALDFYTGGAKPLLSAMARLVPIVVTIGALYTRSHS